MISIDEILYNNLVSWVAAIKSDPTIIDQIFSGKTTDQITQIKQWMVSTAIRIVYHHPRSTDDMPCYAIVLENTSESDQVIGSSGDTYDQNLITSMADGWIGSDSDILRSNINLPVTIKQFYSTTEYYKDGRRVCHIIADQGCGIGKGIFIDFTNSVLEGGSVSLTDMDYVVLFIKSNRIGNFLQFNFGTNTPTDYSYPVSIAYVNTWAKVYIDIRGVADRDKDAIRYMSFTFLDDSAATELFLADLGAQQSKLSVMEETFLDSSYRLESWSNNAELTLVMYQILLWNILKYRTYLQTSWGLFRQRVDGGDIMPQPEFYPEFLYVRGLGYHCSTIETVPRESGLVDVNVQVGKTDFSGD